MSGNWSYWQPWKNQGRKGKPAQNAKGQSKSKKDSKKDGAAQAFPPYDGGGSSSSATPHTSEGIPAEQVLGILQKYAEKDKGLAGEVSALLPQDMVEREELKTQQKHLNQLRKIQGRIYKKEQLLKDKEQQMTKFITDMKKHIEQEKARHRQEVETTQKEIQELRDQLQKVKDGQIEEPEDPAMELDEMLDGPDPEKEQLRMQLEKSEQEKKTMQAQLHQIQGQMMEFMATYNAQLREHSPTLNTPPPLAMTPEQPVKTPTTLPGQGAPVVARQRDALQPFGVARSSPAKTTSGPYAQSEKAVPTEQNKTQFVNLESPDR